MSIYDGDPILDALSAAAASRETARDEYDDTIDGYDREITTLQQRKDCAIELRRAEAEAVAALYEAINARKTELLEANLADDGRLPVGEEP